MLQFTYYSFNWVFTMCQIPRGWGYKMSLAAKEPWQRGRERSKSVFTVEELWQKRLQYFRNKRKNLCWRGHGMILWSLPKVTKAGKTEEPWCYLVATVQPARKHGRKWRYKRNICSILLCILGGTRSAGDLVRLSKISEVILFLFTCIKLRTLLFLKFLSFSKLACDIPVY